MRTNKNRAPRASGGLFPNGLFPEKLFPPGLFKPRSEKILRVKGVESIITGVPGSVYGTVGKKWS